MLWVTYMGIFHKFEVDILIFWRNRHRRLNVYIYELINLKLYCWHGYIGKLTQGIVNFKNVVQDTKNGLKVKMGELNFD